MFNVFNVNLFDMKTILTFLFVLALVPDAYAQDDITLTKSELKKFMKEEREAEKLAEMERMSEQTKLMITQQQFVLEAEDLSVNGKRMKVSSMINYIMVDSSTVQVQDGIPFNSGTNGVGGTTHEGSLLQYEYKNIGKKKESYSVLLSFSCPQGNHVLDISIKISPNGYATGNVHRDKVFHGKLVSLTNSKVYKGVANCRPHSALKQMK